MSMNLSRRSFMKGAAALAAVSAASALLAGCDGSVVTNGVTVSGAARTFKDGENIITLTSTDIDTMSFPNSSSLSAFINSIVALSFKVKNDSKSKVHFVGDINSVKDDGYSIVATACFDGKKPEAKPDLGLANISTGSGSAGGSTSTGNIYAGATDLTNGVDANKTVEGILVYGSSFKNWNQMVLTLSLYKKNSDKQTVSLGTTTYTFNQ